MKTGYVRPSIIALALAAAAFVSTADAQVSTDIPLTIADNGDGSAVVRDTIYFGLNPAATTGRDAGLGEEEQPPAPPEGVFDARWVNVGSTKDFGQGTKRNYHPYASSEQLDTFRLKVQPSFKAGGSGYPVTIAWPDMSRYFTTAALRFVDGDGNATNHDMIANGSYTFSNPSAVTSTITIVTARPKSASGVSMAEALLNLRVVGAPNPARRTEGTSVSYTLPFAAEVNVRLYDVLGATVATLVDEHQEPARRTVHLDTRNLAAGSYYCVITAGQYTAACGVVIVD
jgi:hypothetical protein